VVALVPRALWLRADPPPVGSPQGVGIIWHDEGAWVHNARNEALWGVWRTDEWNPVFVAPVFTALTYGAFEILGVGTWQARTVSVAAGVVSVGALMAGLVLVAGRRSALVGGLLLATNYVFIMWSRVALLESTMTAAMVCSWAAYTIAVRRPAAGAAAGLAATLAWFTKAASAFFAAALLLEALMTALGWPGTRERAPNVRAATIWTIGGLAVSAAVVLVLLVIPYWEDYRFYNWQMSVTRKPEYSIRALADRASWLPFVQGLFGHAWVIVVAGLAGLLTVLARWPRAHPGERLLVLWVVLGFAELIVHDSGNERRYVMFIPALAALTAILLASGRPLVPTGPPVFSRAALAAALPIALGLAYIGIGTIMRPLVLESILAGHLQSPVRLAAVLAVLVCVLAVWQYRRLLTRLSGTLVPGWLAAAAIVLAVTLDATAYTHWLANRTQLNYRASVELGRHLPPGTLVQGKLANGLSLENGVRPLFVGNGFGNYRDRLEREDVRYILTYDLPRIGYESSDGSGLIQGILDHYPGWRVVASFDVEETPVHDRAVLVDKFPVRLPTHAPD
jgi:4-amino-4-deoxy-L-arabinose transferase-like glycosyltransferase